MYGGQAVLGGAGVIVAHSDLHRGTKGWLPGFSDYSLKIGDLRMNADVFARRRDNCPA